MERQERLERAKAVVERRVPDAEVRAWVTHPELRMYGGASDYVRVHALEGTPPRGLVIETEYVTFACEADGRRIATYRAWD